MKRLVLMLKALTTFIVPGVFIDRLADADYELELSRNKQLQAAGTEHQEAHRQRARGAVADHLRFLRARVLKAMIFVASAVVGALVVARLLPSAPIPALTVSLAAASVFLFAWATLGRLGWAGQSFKGDTIVERLDQVLFWSSYWLGTFSGVLAVLAATC
ncbi:MAG: hypothetical protein HY535_03375 [Chloroflexi bacterium]|nr:hypothetical protein [Chloroflexota bacterium]